MKDRMERFVILPFSFGCSSQSSVDVAEKANTHPHKKPPHPPIKKEGLTKEEEEEEAEESSSHEEEEETKTESPHGVSVSPKPSGTTNNNNNNISDGIFRFIRSFKSFSHSFFIRYGDETEETEAEMEIGFPTDVKHVTHIGIDGTMTTFDVPSTPSSFPFARFHLATV